MMWRLVATRQADAFGYVCLGILLLAYTFYPQTERYELTTPFVGSIDSVALPNACVSLLLLAQADYLRAGTRERRLLNKPSVNICHGGGVVVVVVVIKGVG